MELAPIAFFGEAEKGAYHVPQLCHSLPQLEHNFGNPPEETKGLFFAVQTLLYERPLVFLRVHEEGFSEEDYFSGLRKLEDDGWLGHVVGIGIPGVGDCKIIDLFAPVCQKHQNFMIMTEADLYDYLTH